MLVLLNVKALSSLIIIWLELTLKIQQWSINRNVSINRIYIDLFYWYVFMLNKRKFGTFSIKSFRLIRSVCSPKRITVNRSPFWTNPYKSRQSIIPWWIKYDVEAKVPEYVKQALLLMNFSYTFLGNYTQKWKEKWWEIYYSRELGNNCRSNTNVIFWNCRHTSLRILKI